MGSLMCIIKCIATFLVTMFNATAHRATFLPEMLKAHIIILPKPGKNPNHPTNFRPISADVKIYARILAQRLKDALPSLIQPD